MGNFMEYVTSSTPLSSNESTSIFLSQDFFIPQEFFPCFIICDIALYNQQRIKNYMSTLDQNQCHIYLNKNADENSKTLQFSKLISEEIMRCSFLNCVVIGSGSTINIVNYALALLKEQGHTLKAIIIPTNTMSICDVAVGSLGLLNGESKNSVRKYYDPHTIILFKDLYTESPLDQRSDGMIEVAKHCLFQKPNDFFHAIDLFLQLNTNQYQSMDYSILGLHLKIDIMRLSSFEDTKEAKAIFSYGHSYAHAIETFFNYDIPHSYAVFWGIIFELKLCGLHSIADNMIIKMNQSSLKKSLLGYLFIIQKNDKEIVNLIEKKYIQGNKIINLCPNSTDNKMPLFIKKRCTRNELSFVIQSLSTDNS